MERQIRIAAKRNMVIVFPLVDQRNIDGAVNLGAAKQTKRRHVCFGENFRLIIADDQENIRPVCFDLFLQDSEAPLDPSDVTLEHVGSFTLDLGRLRHVVLEADAAHAPGAVGVCESWSEVEARNVCECSREATDGTAVGRPG